jgi:transposase
MKKLWLDEGYKEGCVGWIEETTGWKVEKITVNDGGERGSWHDKKEPSGSTRSGFQVKPRRWVVERTHAWIGRYRRLSKDYEATCSSSVSWIWLAMSRLLLYRLDSS